MPTPGPPTPPPPRDNLSASWRRAGEVGTIGLEMVVAVVACAAAGMWADDHWHLAPWGTLGGLGIGLGAAARSVMRLVRRFNSAAPKNLGPSTKPPERR